MTRKRSISTDISTDARLLDVAAFGPLPLLLYTWAIPHADDWGRLTGDARQLRALICPGLEVTGQEVDVALDQIAGAGLWLRYQVDGKKVIAFPEDSWFRYQSYIAQEKREADKSKFPAPAATGPQPLPPNGTKHHESPQPAKEPRETPQILTSPSPTPSPSLSPSAAGAPACEGLAEEPPAAAGKEIADETGGGQIVQFSRAEAAELKLYRFFERLTGKLDHQFKAKDRLEISKWCAAGIPPEFIERECAAEYDQRPPNDKPEGAFYFHKMVPRLWDLAQAGKLNSPQPRTGPSHNRAGGSIDDAVAKKRERDAAKAARAEQQEVG